MSEESQILVASGSGIQTVIPQLASSSPQVVYLDFNGAETSYYNPVLNIAIDNIVVEDSGFDSDSISLIIDALNEQFGDDVVFTAELPHTDEYSTIYVGVTSAFEDYGDFLGIAETVDTDNQIHDDNAFVLLDSTARIEFVTSVITHEIGHLTGSLKHAGTGINQFTFSSYYDKWDTWRKILDVENGDILTGEFDISEFSRINVLYGGRVSSTYLICTTNVERGGQVETVAVYDDLFIDGGVVADAYVLSGGEIIMESIAGGYAFNIYVFDGGRFECHNGGYVNGIVAYSGAYVTLGTNATYEGQLILAGGDVYIHDYYSYNSLNDASNLEVYFYLDYLLPGDAAYCGEIDWNGEYDEFPGALIWEDEYPNALMNAYLLDGATYYIEVTSNTKPGLYLLADNVGYDFFDETLYIHIEGEDDVIPISVWESKSGYTLYLDQSLYYSNGYDYGCLGLYLIVEPPIQVDFDFKEILQPVFHEGEVPDGMEFEGVPIEFPYRFDVTVTVKKDVADDIYDFYTLVDGLEDKNGEPAYLNYSIQVIDDTCSYLSDNIEACWYGRKIGETEDTYTFKFTDVEDYVLSDYWPDTELVFCAYGDRGSTPSSDTYMPDQTIPGDYSNVKKEEAVLPNYFVANIGNNNDKLRMDFFSIADDDKNEWVSKAQIQLNGNIIGSANVIFDNQKYTDGELFFVVNPNHEESGMDELQITIDTKGVLSRDKWSYSIVQDGKIIEVESPDLNIRYLFAPKDVMACWIATAANMLYRANYLGCTAEKCYEVFRDYYYNMYGYSKTGNQCTIFEKLNILPQSYTDVISYNSIQKLEKVRADGNLVAAVSYDNQHVFTVYDVKEHWFFNEGTLTVADSDFLTRELENRQYEYGLGDAKVTDGAGQWKDISDITILLTNKDDSKKISLEDLRQKFTLEKQSDHLYVYYLNGTVEVNDNFEIINGEVIDAVVQNGGNVCINTHSKANGIMVQKEATVTLEKGAQISGEVKTIGGQITVKSGVDISDAVFDFDLSQLDNANEKVLLYNLNNIANAEKEITVSNEQHPGLYLLASGASSSSLNEISLYGESSYDKATDAGFKDGLLGNLKAGDTIRIEGKTYKLTITEGQLCLTVRQVIASLDETDDILSWDEGKWDTDYTVEFSVNGFRNALAISTREEGIQLLGGQFDNLQWRIIGNENYDWSIPREIAVEADNQKSQIFSGIKDDLQELFLTNGKKQWNGNYCAQHVGVGEWDGTHEIVELDGKNAITDVFAGSDDASILLMTDDDNGDALFIDDIYSAFPEGLDAQARIAKIDEIRAGAGDDIVDLTSQRFDYIGGGMTVHGGLGDDVIWANNGDNTLFGDAGNDRIVGAGGNDVIVGGSGNDSLHGGGGEDIFAFGGDWGNDVVEQLEDGKVTLWFDDGSLEKWDAASLTYRDGDKSVVVSGVTAENISLKFGDDGSEQYGKLLESGAFDEFGSERIFENKNTRGMLA